MTVKKLPYCSKCSNRLRVENTVLRECVLCEFDANFKVLNAYLIDLDKDVERGQQDARDVAEAHADVRANRRLWLKAALSNRLYSASRQAMSA